MLLYYLIIARISLNGKRNVRPGVSIPPSPRHTIEFTDYEANYYR